MAYASSRRMRRSWKRREALVAASRKQYTIWHHVLLLSAFTGMHWLFRPLFRKPRTLWRRVLPNGTVIGTRWTKPLR
jgi:hypothetical protein